MDPIYTMKTTLNGQLMLTMLAEAINHIDSLQMIQINTDGITVKLNRKDLKQYYDICNNWMSITKLNLEYVEYKSMIISDVNNYIAINSKGKIKYKGRYVIDKEYHQDNSFKIVPIALSNYFVNSIPIEETIKTHQNIYDFCGRQKFVGQDYGETHGIVLDKDKLPVKQVLKQQKNTRYYISSPGVTFIKQYKKGTNAFINKGYQVTIFNKYIEKNMKDYKVNYDFYIRECMKEIEQIENKQTLLF